MYAENSECWKRRHDLSRIRGGRNRFHVINSPPDKKSSSSNYASKCRLSQRAPQSRPPPPSRQDRRSSIRFPSGANLPNLVGEGPGVEQSFSTDSRLGRPLYKLSYNGDGFLKSFLPLTTKPVWPITTACDVKSGRSICISSHSGKYAYRFDCIRPSNLPYSFFQVVITFTFV